MGERISETRELWREHCLVGEHFEESTFIGESTLVEHFFGEHFGENTFLESTFFTWRTAFFLTGEHQTPLWRQIYNFLPLYYLAFLVFYLFIAGSF